MYAKRLSAAVFAACFVVSAANAQSVAPAPIQQAPDQVAPAAENALRWLDPVEFAPDAMFAKPPARGSVEEQTDLVHIRALIAAASPERLVQARWDGDHEDPSAFSAAAGRDLTRLPATMALLTAVEAEVDRVVKRAKRHFARPRPYQVDPSLPNCSKGKIELTGYPSGHSGLGWSTAWTLIRLLPDRAPALLARAQDYALSRQLCGSHFSFDLEASHAMAVLAADRLLSDPRLAAQVAAARAELSH